MFGKLVRQAYRYHEVKTVAEYNQLISSLKTPFVVDFYASWCGPCKSLWPVITKRESESNGKWTIIKVDIDLEELASIVNDHQVTGVPTLAFYKEGQKTFQRAGFADDAAFKKLEEKYLS
jgi:thioredoxin